MESSRKSPLCGTKRFPINGRANLLFGSHCVVCRFHTNSISSSLPLRELTGRRNSNATREIIGMRLEGLTIGTNPPDDINVIIEVPVGGEPVKYEMHKEAGTLVVDRFLYTPMRYPGNYGFIPHTLSDDGDPIDVLVCSTRALIPGAVINCRPVGVLLMEDDGGLDEKVIAVPSGHLTRRYDNIQNYSDLPDIQLEQVKHFFEHYKDLEPGKWVKIDRWGDAADSKKLILEAITRAKGKS